MPTLSTKGYVLPTRFLETNILGDMKEGQFSWTPRVNFFVDTDKRCYLNGLGLADDHTTGRMFGDHTDSVLVTRTRDGFTVTIPEGMKFLPAKMTGWSNSSDYAIPVFEVL